MASNYTGVLYITSKRFARGYVEAWVSSETATTATIYWRILCQQKSAALYGQEANGYVDGSWVDWCGGHIDSSSSSWKDVCSASGYTAVNKTTAARSAPVKISTRVTPIDGYGSVTTDWAEATCYVSISAKASYAVKYDANGGSGAPSAQTKWHGTSLKLSTAVPTREGYNFLGWATSSTATSATYASGGSYTANAAATLYAVWELAYAVPAISNLTVARCDSGGAAKAVGKHLEVSFAWALDPALTLASGSISVDGTSLAAVSAASSSSGSVSKVVGGSLSPIAAHLVSVSITDSAGITKSASLTLAAETYSPPVVSSLTAIRADSNGNADEEGCCGKIEFAWSVDEMDGTNALAGVTVGYREVRSTGSYAQAAVAWTGTSEGTCSATIGDDALDVAKSYDILIVVTDNVASATKVTIITRSFFTMDFMKGGKGIAVGKAADKEGLEVDMASYFNKQLVIDDGSGEGSTYDVAAEIAALKAAWDSVSPTTDFVLSQGATGNWTWRRWSSGAAECWGVLPYTVSVTTKWDTNASKFGVISGISFPIALSGTPSIVVAPMSSGYVLGGSVNWLDESTFDALVFTPSSRSDMAVG